MRRHSPLLSFSNSSTSYGEGGNPVKSKLRRRTRIRRSARAEGSSPLAAMRPCTNRSIGPVLGQSFFDSGASGRAGGRYAQ